MDWRFGMLMMSLAAVLAWDHASAATIKEAYQKAQDANGSAYMTEISFAPGSSDLSQDAHVQLRDLLTDARNKGTIADIKVISWADKEYPGKERQTLDRMSRRVADERGLQVRNYLKEQNPDFNVELYNMAERPSAMEKLFNTSSDVHVKDSLVKAGLAHPGKDQPPKASRALVMIVLK